MGIKIGTGGLSVEWIAEATGGRICTVGAAECRTAEPLSPCDKSDSCGAPYGADDSRGTSCNLSEPRGISTDTRALEQGEIYLALAGERFDGHRFIPAAFERGAFAVICSELPENPPAGLYIVTGDSGRALLDMAHAYIRQLPKLRCTVAVTGSVGKTTTKQFIYSVLSQKFRTEKTEGNYNNLVGMPLTVLSTSPDCEALVLEMGMNAKGEISRMSRCAEPDTAVITNIGTAHIGMLGSREEIRDAKLEVLEGLRDGGHLICTDEPLLAHVPAMRFCRGGDIFADDITRSGDGTDFDLCVLGERLGHMHIPVLGEHNVADAAMAACVGRLYGVDAEQIRRGLAEFRNVGARQSISRSGGITAVLDCYNASPESMKVSLGVLRETAGSGRAIAVLGDMLELGEYSTELHRSVGTAFEGKNIDALYTYGDEARHIAETAEQFVSAVHCYGSDDCDALADALRAELREGDTVLFKASNGMRLGELAQSVLDIDRE